MLLQQRLSWGSSWHVTCLREPDKAPDWVGTTKAELPPMELTRVTSDCRRYLIRLAKSRGSKQFGLDCACTEARPIRR